jgi:tetratricopeptide (TPR) repeat protein
MIQEQYEEATPWLEESLEIFEGAGARLSVAMVWGELAVCHLGLGDDARALELFQRSARINQEACAIHNYQVALAIASIGNVYFHRRDYLTALSYYQRLWPWPERSRILLRSRNGHTTSGSPMRECARQWTTSIPKLPSLSVTDELCRLR